MRRMRPLALGLLLLAAAAGCTSQTASPATVTVLRATTSVTTVTVTAVGPASTPVAAPAARPKPTLPTAPITATCQIECVTTADDLQNTLEEAMGSTAWETGRLTIIRGKEKIDVEFVELDLSTGEQSYDLKITLTRPGAIEHYAIRIVDNGQTFFGGASLMKKLGLPEPVEWVQRSWSGFAADSTLALLDDLVPRNPYRYLVLDYLSRAEDVTRGSRGSLSGDLDVDARADISTLFWTGVPDLDSEDLDRALGRQPLEGGLGLDKANLPTSLGWSTKLNDEELSLSLGLYWFSKPSAIEVPDPSTVAG